MWIGTWFLTSYSVGQYIKDNQYVLIVATLIGFVQTLASYYTISLYVFPRYLYTLHLTALLFSLTLIFWLVYVSNYLGFDYMSKYTAALGDVDTPYGKTPYIIALRDRLKIEGVFGCFTDIRLTLWNFAYSLYIVSIFLFFKVAKDIIIYQTRSARSERDRYKLEVDNLQLQQANTDLELDFLKAQVNPHFLFNTLNSVYARVFDSDEQAADLVLRLSELMRYNLYESDVARIALDKELSYVQNYLDLERNRLSDQYVVIDYEQGGNPAAYQIAPLLLIAFVENAFKHGVKGATEPAYVQVSATVTNGQLVFRVENSVPHRQETSVTEPPADSAKKSGGIGLGNVSRRLEALYKARYELVVTPDETSYTVVLILQVETVGTVIKMNV